MSNAHCGNDLVQVLTAMGVQVFESTRRGSLPGDASAPYALSIGDAVQPGFEVTYHLGKPKKDASVILQNQKLGRIVIKANKAVFDEEIETFLTFFGLVCEVQGPQKPLTKASFATPKVLSIRERLLARTG